MEIFHKQLSNPLVFHLTIQYSLVQYQTCLIQVTTLYIKANIHPYGDLYFNIKFQCMFWLFIWDSSYCSWQLSDWVFVHIRYIMLRHWLTNWIQEFLMTSQLHIMKCSCTLNSYSRKYSATVLCLIRREYSYCEYKILHTWTLEYNNSLTKWCNILNTFIIVIAKPKLIIKVNSRVKGLHVDFES